MKCAQGCTCGRHRKRERSEETRRKISENNRARWANPEFRERMSDSFSERQKRLWANPEYRESKTCRGGTPQAPEGATFDSNGYRMVKATGHPLAAADGWVAEHRKALYDLIGPGPHECHWNAESGCGQTDLEWGGREGVFVDHIDGNRSNNDPENVVPSCNGCNLHRHNGTNASRWANA